MTETDTTEKNRKHNHFPMGKTGYDPKVARLMNPDIKKRKSTNSKSKDTSKTTN